MRIIESNLTFKSLTDLGTVKRIILHHAEPSTCSIEDIHRWHLNNGWSGCGYHFLVRTDGSIYRGDEHYSYATFMNINGDFYIRRWNDINSTWSTWKKCTP